MRDARGGGGRSRTRAAVAEAPRGAAGAGRDRRSRPGGARRSAKLRSPWRAVAVGRPGVAAGGPEAARRRGLPARGRGTWERARGGAGPPRAAPRRGRRTRREALRAAAGRAGGGRRRPARGRRRGLAVGAEGRVRRRRASRPRGRPPRGGGRRPRRRPRCAFWLLGGAVVCDGARGVHRLLARGHLVLAQAAGSSRTGAAAAGRRRRRRPGRGSRTGGACGGTRRCGSGAGAAHTRLVSTTTVLVRPWLKLCFTVPALTGGRGRSVSDGRGAPGAVRPVPDRCSRRPRRSFARFAGRPLGPSFCSNDEGAQRGFVRRAAPEAPHARPQGSSGRKPFQPPDLHRPALGARPARRALCITFSKPRAIASSPN